MSELIYLQNARLSFPHLAEPQRQPKPEGGERVSYNAEFILPPGDAGFLKFWEVINKMAVEKWTNLAPAVMNAVQADRKKRCYGAGEEKLNGKTMQPYDGYPGNVFITAGRDSMPQIIDPSGNAVDPANTLQCQALARKMYGGCRVNAAIKPWLQDNKHGKGIRCDLVAVQFFADDLPFGEGAVDASGLFGATPAAAAPAAPAWAPGAPAMPAAPFPAAGAPVMPAAPAAPAWAPPAVPGTPSWMS